MVLRLLGCRCAAKQHPDFLRVFPQSNDEEKRLFELLKKSYIEARYSKSFTVEKSELDYLSERVQLALTMRCTSEATRLQTAQALEISRGQKPDATRESLT